MNVHIMCGMHTCNFAGAKHQTKLLENALSSLLLCESALQHYQPQAELGQASDSGEDSQSEGVGNVIASGKGKENTEECEGETEGGGVEGAREGGRVEGEREGSEAGKPCDPLVLLVLRRLLGVLKQLVAAAMQKR